ncbi:hypothetical protein N0V90_009501 [Kalmusia sp. IMI 367209]|nr:hypothetical protein N0V90_009501 [Kalmusia sp. IMI 367209]
MRKGFIADEKPVGVTDKVLSWCLSILIPLLTVEQLIASVLIAPKRQLSLSRGDVNTTMLGLQLYLVGIGIQEVLVVYTSALAISLNRELRDREVENALAMRIRPYDQASTRWRSISYALVFSLVAILTRIAYRLIELSGFFTGYLLVLAHNEVFFYAIECLPILAALGVWVIVDIESQLDQQSSSGTPIGAYSYHEVGSELIDNSIPLSRVNIED